MTSEAGGPVTSAYSDHIEVPPDPNGDEDDDRRLWIGNLDSRMTEFAILKLVQKYGSIRKMDFIYHKAGPDKGKPRGYCFVSFHTWEAAEKTRKSLDGKLVMSRPMYVKWAQGSSQNPSVTQAVPTSKRKPASSDLKSSSASSSLPAPAAAALSLSSTLATASAETKIQAIEAKLRLMEQTQSELSIDAPIRPPLGLSHLPPTHRQGNRPAPYKKSSQGSHRDRRR